MHYLPLTQEEKKLLFKRMNITEGGCRALLFRSRERMRNLLKHLEPAL